MIRYDIKAYTKEGTYITTINPNVVMNDISFSSNVNGGLGQLNLNLALSFGDTTFHGGEIIKVILYNERYKQGKQIYMWFVSQISRVYDTNKGYIKLVCLWIASLLTSVLFTWSYNGTAETILNAIIAEFNSNYAWSLISVGGIDEYEENINVEFKDWTSCQKAIEQVNEIANYYRFINAEWKFYFRKKGTQTEHIMANKQEVESMNLNYSIESIVNRIFVARKDGTVKMYEDNISQSLYGIKEEYSNQQSIVDATTQDEFGNNYIAQYSNPKNASTVVVNSEYDIEKIEPWDTITIVNSEYEIKNLTIEKINYSPSKVTLTLEENESLWSVISE